MTLPADLPLGIAMAAMVGVALLVFLPGLFSRDGSRTSPSPATLNAAVYKSQLADLEGELAAHRMSAADFADARAEIERRALDEAEGDIAPRTRAGRVSAAALAVAFPVAAVALYGVFGHPASVADLTGPAQDAPAFRARLVDHLGSHSRDGRGWAILARMDMADERFAEAAASYRKAIAVSPKIAADAGVWCELADALGMASGGSLEGEPTAIIERALAMAPAHPVALEMAGSAAYQRGDYRRAARHWSDMLPLVAGEARDELRAAIARAEGRARISLPPPDPNTLAAFRR